MSEDLIRQLVSELEPVERLSSPARRAMSFALPMLVLVAVGAWLVGVRFDLLLQLHSLAYLAETAFLVVLFGATTLAALSSGVPGQSLSKPALLIATAAGAWLLLVVVACYLSARQLPSVTAGVACLSRTLMLGSAPGVTLFFMLRRAAPLNLPVSGALVASSAGALAVLGTRLLCSKDEGMHVLMWHVLPLAALAALGAVIGQLAKRRRTGRPRAR